MLRIALKILITALAMTFAPNIARSGLIFTPRNIAADPALLAAFQRTIARVIRVAAIAVLAASLLVQRALAQAS